MSMARFDARQVERACLDMLPKLDPRETHKINRMKNILALARAAMDHQIFLTGEEFSDFADVWDFDPHVGIGHAGT